MSNHSALKGKKYIICHDSRSHAIAMVFSPDPPIPGIFKVFPKRFFSNSLKYGSCKKNLLSSISLRNFVLWKGTPSSTSARSFSAKSDLKPSILLSSSKEYLPKYLTVLVALRRKASCTCHFLMLLNCLVGSESRQLLYIPWKIKGPRKYS